MKFDDLFVCIVEGWPGDLLGDLPDSWTITPLRRRFGPLASGPPRDRQPICQRVNWLCPDWGRLFTTGFNPTHSSCLGVCTCIQTSFTTLSRGLRE